MAFDYEEQQRKQREAQRAEMAAEEAALRAKVKRIFKTITYCTIGFMIFGISFSACGTVGYGERGVLLRFNKVTGTVFGEGIYFKVPIMHSVEILNVKTQKLETEADAATKDLQTVSSKIALNFHLSAVDQAEAGKVGIAHFFDQYGHNFVPNVLDPGLHEILKAVTAKYTAEEVITKREQVREDTNILLRNRFGPLGITIDGLNIVNFTFSKSFNDSIEAKVTQEQRSLTAQRKLEQIKFEAQQVIEAAAGKAKAIQIEGDALTKNPEVVKLRAIEKWNGVSPQVMAGGGSVVPFVNIAPSK